LPTNTPSAPDTAGKTEEAGLSLAGTRCWIVTDGKAGDLNQCLGVAERLGLTPDIRTVSPRAPFVWLMPLSWRLPYIATDPRERPGMADGPLAGALPDLVIASGRRAAPYLPAIKRASGGRTFTVCLKDPRTSNAIADFLWVPEHDRLRGPNVMTTLLSPHRITPVKLAVIRAEPPPRIAALPKPRVALLIGGNSKDFTFSEGDITRFVGDVGALAATGAGIMATASRRTPPGLAAPLRALVEQHGGWFWDGAGENPYPAFLALADALVVTAESVNMIGEALATGQPVHLFRPTGGSRKIDQFLRGLEAKGLVHPFSGRLQTDTTLPVDETAAIANEIARRFRMIHPEAP
jgi:uncharacterized protein